LLSASRGFPYSTACPNARPADQAAPGFQDARRPVQLFRKGVMPVTTTAGITFNR